MLRDLSRLLRWQYAVDEGVFVQEDVSAAAATGSMVASAAKAPEHGGTASEGANQNTAQKRARSPANPERPSPGL